MTLFSETIDGEPKNQEWVPKMKHCLSCFMRFETKRDKTQWTKWMRFGQRYLCFCRWQIFRNGFGILKKIPEWISWHFSNLRTLRRIQHGKKTSRSDGPAKSIRKFFSYDRPSFCSIWLTSTAGTVPMGISNNQVGRKELGNSWPWTQGPGFRLFTKVFK